MKYNIYINQKVLADTELDLSDATILDYLYFLCGSVNIRIENQRVEGYTWVDYGELIEQNPMLRISSRGAITRRIKKLKDSGFIDTLEKRKNGHKFIYIRMKSKIDTLFTDMNRIQKPIHEKKKPIHSGEKPIHESEPIKTTTNNTTKDKGTSNEVAYVIKLFEKLDIKNKNYYNHTTQRKSAEFLLKEHGVDTLTKVIDVYVGCKGDRFLPSISSPYEMVEKWSKLEDYFRRKKSDEDELQGDMIAFM